MEPAATPTLWDNITSVITNIISCLGNVANALMGNQLFQITLGIVIFGIVFGIIFRLVRKIRKQGK